ncbi:hypothetical protein VaNZ11_013222 [Volvox africanus]|uniref:Uncharacterized protein n=1 Tax=Volvox africanus TaxID=51714 RepID=A0ABQ5SFM3_9CHLO|nr:hypothetical protein VaNZ11_013222 [Volvox africanus]
MSQGRWVASSELEGQGVQPQVREQGRGVDSTHPERGLERTFLRKGSFTHADLMGTSQQLNSPTTRKGETLDIVAGREMISARPVTVRPSSNYGGGNGPPVVTTHNTARGLSRPSPPPASYGSMLSPRTHHSTSYGSYRDVALAAAQHGLSAYAQSAAAAAAAAMIRSHTPRSGGGTAAVATPGRPPPAPRPTQHSAPMPMANTAPNGPVGEFLPSCGVAPPISSSVPASRGLSFLPSRCSAPSPNSPGRGDVSASAPSGSVTSHRSGGDVAVVTVTYNDVWWRGAFEGSVEPDDPSAAGGGGGGGGGGSVGATGAIRVMSPGWGAAPPSVCEADGRPGTRGGGPLFDIEGRPTTRNGQRPPSRALLNLAQHRPPAHVAPLGGQGWPGLFASGCNTASGEALMSATVSLPPPYSPSPRTPSAGTSISWSGDAAEPPGSHRRQLVPLTPTIPGSAAAARLSSPQARAFGNGSTGVAGPGGVLTSLMPPSHPVGLAPVTSPHSPQGLPPPVTSPTQRLAAAGGGACGVGSSSSSSSSSSNSLATSVCVGSGSGGGSGGSGGGGGGTRAQLTSKLSSIAEMPGSPVLLPLPPQPQPQPQQQKQPSKSSAASARVADGIHIGGRKAPRERGASGFLAAFLADGTDAEQSPLSPSMFSEEGLIDDSRRTNYDQNSGSCGTDLAGRGHDEGGVSGGGNVTMTGTVNGGGRARPRRSSSNTLTAGAGTSSYLRGHGSLTPDLTGWLQGPSESASQTDETPSNRPRR